MTYTTISPLGKREGFGTFETFFDTDKYSSINDAAKQNDYVVVDFVKDEEGTIYFKAYHSNDKNASKIEQLNIQHFPCGIDVMDDNLAVELAMSFLHKEQIKHEVKHSDTQSYDFRSSFKNTPHIIKDSFDVDPGDTMVKVDFVTGKVVESFIRVYDKSEADVEVLGFYYKKDNIE